MATVTQDRIDQAEQRFLLRDVSWETYEALCRDPGIRTRMTYDRGMLEFWSPSYLHECLKCLLARLVHVVTEELNIPVQGCGSTTYRRAILEKGLEPDQCYYIQHESVMRGKDDLDFDVDPPPDLAIEVEVTRSALDRMGIYAALGVPEVWRFDGTALRAFVLGEDGKYESGDHSPTFPDLPLDELVRFVEQRKKQGETALVRSFRQWVRENLKDTA